MDGSKGWSGGWSEGCEWGMGKGDGNTDWLQLGGWEVEVGGEGMGVRDGGEGWQ